MAEDNNGEEVVVSYDEMFPVLQTSNVPGPTTSAAPTNKKVQQQQPSNQNTQWNNKMRVSSSSVTQVFYIPPEERKFGQSDKFGEEKESQRCAQIMKATGAHIEISTSRDQNLTFLVTGKQDKVLEARRQILSNFQTPASKTITIPKEHHKNILGKAGQRLQDLEKVTATKISIPNIKDNSEEIVITGPREGIEKAVHEMQVISDEQSKKAFERISIPKKYHPFICGAHNTNVQELQNKHKVRINVPPPSVDSDQITISGEKEGVIECVGIFKKIHDNMEQNAKTVSIEVSKSQHKYIIGQKRNTIAEILEKTGVSVEMPSADSNSETIVLRGPQVQLGNALNMVYEKANSAMTATVQAPGWIHKFIIGRDGVEIKKITADKSNDLHVEFIEDTIKVEGPKEDVKDVVKALEAKSKSLISQMKATVIPYDPNYLKHIVGKGWSNINKLKEENNNVIINFTDLDGTAPVIQIEGKKANVDAVEEELKKKIHKLENEKEKDCIIGYQLHKQIIGAKGESVRKLQEQFDVQIIFPNFNEKSDVVRIRGPKENVDECDKHLKKLVKEIKENSFQLPVRINKQYHRFIIGKAGATIRKIREDTGTKIDLPPEDDEKNDVIMITGTKEAAHKAESMIMEIMNEMVNVVQEEVVIPSKHYNFLIGAKGKLIQAIKEDCGGVIIKFPPQDSKSDKVIIRGAADDVKKAKAQLLEYADQREQSSYTEEIKVPSQHSRYLKGKVGSAKLKKIKDQTGARIILPSELDDDKETVTIIGKEEGVIEAKKELLKVIKDHENIVEDSAVVEPQYHRHFMMHRCAVLNKIIQDCGDIAISFPKQGTDESTVTLRGEKAAIEAAKEKIENIVQELKDHVTIQVIIPQIHHRAIMTYRSDLAHIRSHFNVEVQFPAKPTGELMNGDAHSENGQENRKEDIVTIGGTAKNCEAAKEALLALVPVELVVDVPYEYHRSIIGVKGSKIRELQDDFGIRIEVPKSEEQLNTIKLKGRPADLEAAKSAILNIIDEKEKEREDRERKSFQLKIEVDPIYHPKIIGRKGETINSIRKKHDVQVIFQKQGDPDEHIITLEGYQESTEAARDSILSIVKHLESLYKEEVQIDSRVHRRIIGGQGRTVRSIMDKYKVDIKFPRESDPDPNLVIITGEEDDVLDAKDRLLNMEDSFLQDLDGFLSSNGSINTTAAPQNVNPQQPKFVIKEAPWDREQTAPDTASTQDFPSFRGAGSSLHGNVAWGPRR